MSEDVLAHIDELVRELAMAPNALQDMRDADPGRFANEVLRILRSVPESPASERLLKLIIGDDAVLAQCTDPCSLSLVEARELARRMRVLDPGIDLRFLKLLLPPSGPAIRDSWRATRLLEIVETVSDGTRTHSALAQLLWHSDSRISSKAALLIGRQNPDVRCLEQWMSTNDARVRANVIESLWGVASPEAVALFRGATKDSDH